MRKLLFFLLAHAAFGEEIRNPILTKPDKSEALDAEDKEYLLRHNPFYFAYGNPISKIQLSFRTRVHRGVPLYLAYTQRMFWALQQDNKPFKDSIYNPEIFYRFKIAENEWLKDLDFGWLHISNGKGATPQDERSYNAVYARVNLEKELRRWIFRMSIAGAYLHSFQNTNRDIQDYVGPLSVKFAWIQLYNAWVDKSEFSFEAAPGGKFSQNLGYGGYQISWSFRLGGINLIPSFYLQYYNGFAESLINYDQYVHAFRAGVIF